MKRSPWPDCPELEPSGLAASADRMSRSPTLPHPELEIFAFLSRSPTLPHPELEIFAFSRSDGLGASGR